MVEHLKNLREYFNVELSAEATKEWLEALKYTEKLKHGARAVREAVEVFKRERKAQFKNEFPSMGEFVEKVDEIIRGYDSAQDEKVYDHIYDTRSSDACHRDFAELMHKVTNHQITRLQAAEEMEKLGKKHGISEKNIKREAHHMMSVSDW
jgi:hypothetical protein